MSARSHRRGCTHQNHYTSGELSLVLLHAGRPQARGPVHHAPGGVDRRQPPARWRSRRRPRARRCRRWRRRPARCCWSGCPGEYGRPRPGNGWPRTADAVLSMLATAEAELDGRTTSLRVAAFPTAVIGLLPAALVALRTTPSRPARAGPRARAGRRAGPPCAPETSTSRWSTTTRCSAPDTRGPWRVEHVADEPVLAALPRDHLARDAAVRAGRAAARGRLDHAEAGVALPGPRAARVRRRRVRTDGRGRLRRLPARSSPSSAPGRGVSLVPQTRVTGVDVSAVALVPLRPAVRRRINALVSTRPGVRLAAGPLVDVLRDAATS